MSRRNLRRRRRNLRRRKVRRSRIRRKVSRRRRKVRWIETPLPCVPRHPGLCGYIHHLMPLLSTLVKQIKQKLGYKY